MSAYEKELKKKVLTPLFRKIRYRLQLAEKNYVRYRQIFRDIANDPRVIAAAASGGQAAAASQARRLHAMHKKRWERLMRRHLGVEVVPSKLYGQAIDKFIQTNVDLIVTIPKRALGSLAKDLQKLEKVEPFNEAEIAKVVGGRYGSTGYNLRRIARDQTNKLIGQFNELRNVNAGIKEYIWSSSGDNRVRPTHIANDGVKFRWDNPPPTGHPGWEIQCRCVAYPVLPKVVPKPKPKPAPKPKPKVKPKPPPAPPKPPPKPKPTHADMPREAPPPALEDFANFHMLTAKEQKQLRAPVKKLLKEYFEREKYQLKPAKVAEKDTKFWKFDPNKTTNLELSRPYQPGPGLLSKQEVDNAIENMNKMLPERVKQLLKSQGTEFHVEYKHIKKDNYLGLCYGWFPNFGVGRVQGLAINPKGNNPVIWINANKWAWTSRAAETTMVHEVLHAVDDILDRGLSAKAWDEKNAGSYGRSLMRNAHAEMKIRRKIYAKSTGQSAAINDFDYTFRRYEGTVSQGRKESAEYITVTGENYFAAKRVLELVKEMDKRQLAPWEEKFLFNTIEYSATLAGSPALKKVLKEGATRILRTIERRAPHMHRLLEYLSGKSPLELKPIKAAVKPTANTFNIRDSKKHYENSKAEVARLKKLYRTNKAYSIRIELEQAKRDLKFNYEAHLKAIEFELTE